MSEPTNPFESLDSRSVGLLQPEAPTRSPPWTVRQALPVALPATVVFAATPQALGLLMERVPWMGGPLIIGGFVGAAVGWWRARWSGLWPVNLILPGSMLAAASHWGDMKGQLGVLMQNLPWDAASMLWEASGGAALTWLWVGGAGRGRLLRYLTAVGLTHQLVWLGIQLLVPGLVFAVLSAPVYVVAARSDAQWTSWMYHRAGTAALCVVACAASPVAYVVTLMLAIGPKNAFNAMMVPGIAPPGAHAAATTASHLVFGLLVAMAAGVWDRQGPAAAITPTE